MLEIKNLTKQFEKVLAVNDISFNVEKGKIFGIVGRNGAGKSTTFRMILNLIEPTKGSIKYNGEKINLEIVSSDEENVLLYRFWIKRNQGWELLKDYSIENKLTFTTTKVGEGEILIECKRPSSDDNVDDFVTIKFNVKEQPVIEINSFECLSKSLLVGEEIIFKVGVNYDKHRTILAPFFTDYASPLLPEVFALSGYKLEVLPLSDKKSADLGLQYSNNEVCYPATLIVGDMIKALSSGKYDLNTTAVGITQTGGQCRASNYYPVIRKALVDAGFANVPVISAAMSSNVRSNQPGFKLDFKNIAVIAFDAILFGDCLSKLYHSTAVRIENPSLALELKNQYLQKAKPIVLEKDRKGLIALLKNAVKEFNKLLPEEYLERKKVGIVGEIFLKFYPFY